MLNRGILGPATREYAWLWDNMLGVKKSYSGVRSSFMAGEMERLARMYRPARARFTELRDRAGVLAARPTPGPWRSDWMVLNEVLGEEHLTLAWYDEAQRQGSSANVTGPAPSALISALLAKRRWADVGRLYAAPLRDLARFHWVLAHTRGMPRADVLQIETTENWFREQVAVLLRCLVAAGRSVDAANVAREALVIDGSEAMHAAVNRELGPASPS